jgi:HSP20 family protein
MAGFRARELACRMHFRGAPGATVRPEKLFVSELSGQEVTMAMNTIPFRPASDLFRSVLEDLGGPGVGWGGRMAGMELTRAPHADVLETMEEIRVSLELPGLRPEEVDVSLENNILTISGEKHREHQETDHEHRWHLSERRYGRFHRSFVLPRDVDQEQIRASFENGVLNVTVPKSERARPRRIQIQVGNGQQQIETGER